MARERGTSLLNVADHTSFLGPKVPDEIKRIIPMLSKVDRNLMRNLLQVAIRDLEGLNIPDKTFQSLVSDDIPEENLCTLYAGILVLLKLAFRFPQSSLKQEAFNAELQEIKIPKEFIEDLSSVVFGPKYDSIEKVQLQKRLRLPTVESLKWRVDVAISTSVLNRVLEPTILMEMKLTDGKSHTFEIPLSKFHELRYNVSFVLKEMEDLEKKSVLKIKD